MTPSLNNLKKTILYNWSNIRDGTGNHAKKFLIIGLVAFAYAYIVPIERILKRSELDIGVFGNLLYIFKYHAITIIIFSLIQVFIICFPIALRKITQKIIISLYILSINYILLFSASVFNFFQEEILILCKTIYLVFSCYILIKFLMEIKNFVNNRNLDKRINIKRLILPVTLASILLTRYLYSPNSSTDSIIYHTGLAKSWSASWPDFPKALGPSVGQMISFSYPNLTSGLVFLVNKISGINFEFSSKIVFTTILLLILLQLHKIFPKYNYWVGLFIFTIPLSINSFFEFSNYALLILVCLLLVSISIEKTAEVKFKYFILAILLTIGVIGIFYALVIASIGILKKIKTIHTIHGKITKSIKIIFAFSPILLLTVTLIFRNKSIFYPFILFPAKYDAQYLALLADAKKSVINNSIVSIGANSLSSPRVKLLFKYFISSYTNYGGLLLCFVILFLVTKLSTKKIIFAHENLAFVLIPILFFSVGMYWFRYISGVLIAILVIILLELKQLTSNIRFRNNFILKSSASALIVIKILIVSLGIETDSANAFMGPTTNHSTVPPFSDLVSKKFTQEVNFGSRPIAWSDIKNIIHKKYNVGVYDLIAASEFATEYSNLKDLSGDPTWLINKNQNPRDIGIFPDFLFISGEYIDGTKVIGNSFKLSTFWKSSTDEIYEVCAIYPPIQVELVPNVLWKKIKLGEDCSKYHNLVVSRDGVSNIGDQSISKQSGNTERNFITSWKIQHEFQRYVIYFRAEKIPTATLEPIHGLEIDKYNKKYRLIIRKNMNMEVVQNFTGSLPANCQNYCSIKLDPQYFKNGDIATISIDGYTTIKDIKIIKKEK